MADLHYVVGPVSQRTHTLRATVTPSDATDKTVLWRLSGDSIATIDRLDEDRAQLTLTGGRLASTLIRTCFTRRQLARGTARRFSKTDILFGRI